MTTPTDPPAATGRAIELEVEVPGTPEEVWDAIASGPGITSWFVPTTVEPSVGGAVRQHFGEGMDVEGRVTAWEPPRRFAYAGRDDAEGADPGAQLAFEFLVEARGGGSCIVRLVNSGFGDGEEWDAHLRSMEQGWRVFLDVLRLVRTHFPGRAVVPVQVLAMAAGELEATWAKLAAGLGLAGATTGAQVASGPGAPELVGVVEATGPQLLLLRLERPAPGIAFVTAEGAGEAVALSIFAYLTGPEASARAVELEPGWQAWLASLAGPAAPPA